MIKSWATHEWYLPPEAENLPRFSHVSTHIRDEGADTGLRAGDTVWMAQDEDWHVGLAWEWVEVKPGLVMLADPNSIITNLQLVDSQQRNVHGLEKTVAINRLVHAMQWQQPVCDLLTGANASPHGERPALDSRANLTHGSLWQRDTGATGGDRRVSTPTPWHAEATHQRPAVVHMSEKTVLRPRARDGSRRTDLDEGARAAPTRELRRAA